MKFFAKEESPHYAEVLRRKAEEALKSMQKSEEKIAAYKQILATYKEILTQHDIDFQKSLDANNAKFQEVVQALENTSSESIDTEQLTSIEETLKLLKEKQEATLLNFPVLEGNIVEKVKNAQVTNKSEILDKFSELDAAITKRNQATKTLLWISLLLGLVNAAGIAFIICYLLNLI